MTQETIKRLDELSAELNHLEYNISRLSDKDYSFKIVHNDERYGISYYSTDVNLSDDEIRILINKWTKRIKEINKEIIDL